MTSSDRKNSNDGCNGDLTTTVWFLEESMEIEKREDKLGGKMSDDVVLVMEAKASFQRRRLELCRKAIQPC